MPPTPAGWQFGDIVVDRTKRRVTCAGHALHLRPIEFRLLDLLLQNGGKVLSRQEIFTAVWGASSGFSGRRIDVAVGRLRKALKCRQKSSPIKTIGGRGYSFSASAEKVTSFQSARSTPLKLHRATRSIRRLGQVLCISPKPFAVLDLLISNTGQVFGRKQIAEAVWGANPNVDLRTVDATVARLRREINRRVLPDPIRTVTRAGYAFSEFFNEALMEPPQLRRRKVVLIPKSSPRISP